MEWLPPALEIVASVVLGIAGWSLTSLLREVREMVDKHHDLDKRIAVLEAMADGPTEERDPPRRRPRDPR